MDTAEYKKRTASKRTLQRATGSSSFQPTSPLLARGDAQHREGECIIDTADGKEVGIVLKLSVAIPMFCYV